MGKKRYVPPKSFPDLLALWYGPYRNGTVVDHEKNNRHNKHVRNPNNYPDGLNESERHAKNFLSPLGEIKKLKENGEKIPDFELHYGNTQIDFEVKSINTAYDEKTGEINQKTFDEWVKKINLTIDAIYNKRRNSNILVGVICPETTQWLFTLDDEKIVELINKSKFRKSSLDAILILIKPVSGNCVAPPTTLFIKSDGCLYKLFQDSYTEEKLRIIKLQDI